MWTGWHPKFRTERGIQPVEAGAALDIECMGTPPDDVAGMTRFSSTYLEFVDRTFKIKGMVPTLIYGALCLFLFLAMVMVGKRLVELEDGVLEIGLYFIPVGLIAGCGIALFWHLQLRMDLFQYTHYPVRFNRLTRKIYFFRHNGPGGVVVVPWGSPFAFFHIGRGGQDPNLRDLRCHLLDRNRQVQQTFTIGHFWDHDQDIREEWALICRYMQDGPEACFDDPLDRVITLSTLPTFRNHWMLVCLMMGTNLFPLRHNLLFPLYGALTLSRWLTFKTCKAPVFPPEIEAECAIAPDDPYALPEPRFMAEFASDPAIYERARRRHLEKIMWR